jgi:hypothetical protein
MRNFHTARKLTVALLFTASVVSCYKAVSNSGRKPDEERRIEATSSRPIDPAALRQEAVPNAMKRLPRVESVGDCAPRYKIGGQGTCIENKPCRGFGVQDEKGNILCTCYGAPGCAEGQRCDDRKLVCVPEDEPLEDRVGTM